MKATPQQLMEDLWAARRTQVLVAGIELDLFTHIAQGRCTASEIAGAAGASRRGIVRLLDALVGMGYLTKRGSRYGLKPVAREFLVRGRDSYRGDGVEVVRLHWQHWAQLTQAVRSGRPVVSVDTEERGRDFFPKLVKGIFASSFAGGQAAVQALSRRARMRIKQILDVAAGSGAWSIPFAQAIPQARVVALDFPAVARITRQFARRYGVAKQYEYLAGNLRQVDLGRERYDLVILGNIIHSEGATWGRNLLKRSQRALREGGLLLIAEIVPNDARTGPPIPLLFSLNMLLHSQAGDVFTLREYRRWLREAGFRSVRTTPAPTLSPLIWATK